MISYGYEIEWGNIDKTKSIPPSIAYWEGNGNHAECDIINCLNGVWQPAYPNRRYGAEINLTPKYSIDEMVESYIQLENLFPEKQVTPISNGHVHVKADWFDDVDRLKDWAIWVNNNFEQIIELTLQWTTIPDTLPTSIKRYLKYDGGIKFNRSVLNNIQNATTITDIINSDRRGNSTMRFPRAFVNLRPLGASGTIEFRHFKMPANSIQFKNQLIFVEGLLNKEIRSDLDLPKLDCNNLFNNPEFIQCLDVAWETREERKKLGKKVRMNWN